MKRLGSYVSSVPALLMIAGVILLGAFRTSADTFEYSTVSVTNEHSRGGRNRYLFRFSLTLRTNTYTNVSVNAFTFIMGQSTGPSCPLLNATIYLVENGQETALASAPPLDPYILSLIFNSPLDFAADQTKTFLLRGDFYLMPAPVTGGWSNTRFAISGFQTIIKFLAASPSTGITLSNADTGGSSFTNEFRIWDNVVSISNAFPSIGNHTTIERSSNYTMLGISVRNTHFDLSGGKFSLNSLLFNVPTPDICKSLKLYLDNGDTNWGPSDSLIGTFTPSAGQTNYWAQFSSPVLLSDAAQRIIWARVEVAPNAPTNANFFLTCISGDTNFFVQYNRIVPDKPWSDMISPGNTVVDTNPPGSATEINALAGDKTLFIRWRNPVDTDLANAYIVYKPQVSGYPTGPLDGTSLALPLTEASAGQAMNSLISNIADSSYYLCLFLQDSAGNTSCAFSNLFTSTTIYNDTPPIPSGIAITPTKDNLEITWNTPTNADHYGIMLKAFVNNPYLGIFAYPSIVFTNSAIIPKSALGITYDGDQEYYIGVIAVDINGYTSINNFTTETDARQYGIFIRYSPFYTGGNESKVYRNVFRPDSGEYARILVNVTERTSLIVKIYSISGDLMRTLANRTVDPGQHEFRWFGNDSGGTVNPGVYIAHVRSKHMNKTHKIVVRR